MGAYEFDSDGIRIIGAYTPISFYDSSRTLQQEIYLQDDNTLNIGDAQPAGGSGSGGVSDHGSLSGLSDTEDHLYALLKDGSRKLSANWDAGARTISIDQLNESTGGSGITLGNEIYIKSADQSNQIEISHDDTDGYIKWDDGSLILLTDEGTNTNTTLEIKGKGTGIGVLRLYDADDAESLSMYTASGHGYIFVAGTSPGTLLLQSSAEGDVSMFASATSGETQELKIFGFKVDDAARSLEIGVGVDADDTASFDGLTFYLFDGIVQAKAAYITRTTDAVALSVTGHTTQSNNLMEAYTTVGGKALVFEMDTSGNLNITNETPTIKFTDITHKDFSIYADADLLRFHNVTNSKSHLVLTGDATDSYWYAFNTNVKIGWKRNIPGTPIMEFIGIPLGGEQVFAWFDTPGDFIANYDIRIDSDSQSLELGDGQDMDLYYDGTDGHIRTDLVAASDLFVDCGTEKTLELVTPTYEDLQVSISNIRIPASNAPTERLYAHGIEGGVTFPVLGFAVDDYLYFDVQTSHGMKINTILDHHIHFTLPNTTDIGDKWKFQLDVIVAGIDDDWAAPAGSPFTSEYTIVATDNTKHRLLEIADIPASNTTVSTIYKFKLTRIAASADEYASEVYLEFTDCHYQKIRLGSRAEDAV